MKRVGIGLVLLMSPASAFANAPEEPQPRINGGADAAPCQWPTTVLLTSNGSLCSGVLIHPELVVSAAHCVDPDSPPHDVKFGELSHEPQRKVQIDYCQRSPNYDGIVGGTDIAFCRLVEPVEFVPATPVVYGCETVIIDLGNKAMIAGYGKPEEGEPAGTKRFTETLIVQQYSETAVMIGQNGDAACSGDSGSPAYIQYPDGSWHVIGVLSGGWGDCGNYARVYVRIHPWIPWMETATGLDLTPCHDRDGTWNPTDRCGRFAIDPMQDQVTWDDWCGSAVTGPSETCAEGFKGELYDPYEDTALDEPLDEDGCGCRSRERRAGGSWAWACLLVLVWRQRTRRA
jgi:hypothetical protein